MESQSAVRVTLSSQNGIHVRNKWTESMIDDGLLMEDGVAFESKTLGINLGTVQNDRK